MKLSLKLFPVWVVCAVVVGWVGRASADFALLPFHDSFESSILNTNYWTLQGAWGQTTESANTGTNSLTDSPRAVYTNNADSSAILSVDLRSAWAPMLRFWNRYAFEPNRDFGFVEVSADFGASWARWDAVTGQGGTNWYPAQLDLTPYAGTMLMIRFRLVSNGANPYDGWYIDDVSVTENPALAVYPFFDNVDRLNQQLAGVRMATGARRRPRLGRTELAVPGRRQFLQSGRLFAAGADARLPAGFERCGRAAALVLVAGRRHV